MMGVSFRKVNLRRLAMSESASGGYACPPTEVLMMTARKLLAAVFVPLLLACGGLGNKDDEVEDTAGGDGLPVTQACQDYLDCVAAVDAATLGTLLTSYGEGGTCWTTGQDAADVCDQACQTGLDQLHDQNPTEAACGDVEICTVIEGEWEVVITRTGGDCEFPWEQLDSPGELTCTDASAGTFEAEFYTLFPTVFDCAAVGSDFTCETEYQGVTMVIDGHFDTFEEASGGWTLSSAQCEALGPFEMSMR